MLSVLCPHCLRLALTALYWLHLIFNCAASKRSERKLLLHGCDLSSQEEVIWVTSDGVQVQNSMCEVWTNAETWSKIERKVNSRTNSPG